MHKKEQEKKEHIRSLAGSFSTTTLNGNPMTLALEALGGNKTLNLRGLGVILLAFTGDSTTDDELANIILLVEGEEVTDLGGTLRTETLGDNSVGKAREFTITLLYDAEGQNSQIGTSNCC